MRPGRLVGACYSRAMETLETAESTPQAFERQTASTRVHVGDGAASQQASLFAEAP